MQAFIAEHTDLAVERFDGEEAEPSRMRESVSGMPFLTARKMVVLHSPGKQKAFSEHIDDILAETADTTDLLLIEPKLDKRLSYYKTLKKKTDFREFGDLDAGGLARWVCDYVKNRGGRLDAPDARLLIDRAGPNQQLLQQELDKLLAYDDRITRQTIELLVEPLPQSSVFELLDAAFSGKAARTFELYQEQRALKVEPQAIISMLAWQLHILTVIKAAGQRGVDDIARAAKLNPFVVRKSQGLVRSVSMDQLKRMIDDLLVLDLRLKTTAVNADEALQFYLLQLTG